MKTKHNAKLNNRAKMWPIFYLFLLSGLVTRGNAGRENTDDEYEIGSRMNPFLRNTEQYPGVLHRQLNKLIFSSTSSIDHKESFIDSTNNLRSNLADEINESIGFKLIDQEAMRQNGMVIRRSRSPNNDEPPTNNHIQKQHSKEKMKRHGSPSSSSPSCSDSSSGPSDWSGPSSSSSSSSSFSYSSSPSCSSSSESREAPGNGDGH